MTERSRLLLLLKKYSFKKTKIKLSSGKLSNYYINAKPVTMSAEGAYLVAKLFLEIIKREKAKAVGGLTLGADPILGALAAVSFKEKYPLKTLIVRKEPKGHGTRRLIEGPLLPKGTRVIAIDDVATTGASTIKAIQALREGGYVVNQAIAVVDRLEGARENLNKNRCSLTSLFSSRDFGV